MSTKAGIIKCSIGVAVVLSLTLTADVLGYGYFVVLPLLIGGLALLGVGIVDTIVGITRARLGWIALMTLRGLGAILAVLWLFVGGMVKT